MFQTFKLSILKLLLRPLIFFVLKKVNSPKAGQELGMFTPEGPEVEHFVSDLTFKDNFQSVSSKFLKNIQLILNNSNSDLVELHSTSPLTNSQSTENSTVYDPHNYNYEYFNEELR